VSTIITRGERGRTDDFCFERLTIVQRGLRTNDLRWLCVGRKHVTTRLKKCTCRLHCLRALLRLLLLALGRAEEATKEARFFFLHVHLEILVVVQLCGGQLSLFGLGCCGLIGVQAVRDECHSLEKGLDNEYK
jgi:hypothetical protein